MDQVEPQNKQDTLPTDSDFTGATLTLPDKQRTERDNPLNELHQSLASASYKLDEAHEPYMKSVIQAFTNSLNQIYLAI